MCFLMLPFAFYPRPQGEEFNISRFLTTFFIVNNIFIIAFYYLNTYLIIPKLLDQKKFWSYGLLIFALLVIYSLMRRIYHVLFGSLQPQNAVQPPRQGPPRTRPLVNAGNIAIFLLVF